MSPCRALSEVQSSQLSESVFERETERGGLALSMCDSSVPDTLITLHVTCWHTHMHTHTQIKQERVRGHEIVKQTRTTRKEWKKGLVDNERQKWEREVDLPFCVLVER